MLQTAQAMPSNYRQNPTSGNQQPAFVHTTYFETNGASTTYTIKLWISKIKKFETDVISPLYNNDSTGAFKK
jgi:hypothetical protein